MIKKIRNYNKKLKKVDNEKTIIELYEKQLTDGEETQKNTREEQDCTKKDKGT